MFVGAASDRLGIVTGGENQVRRIRQALPPGLACVAALAWAPAAYPSELIKIVTLRAPGGLTYAFVVVEEDR